MERIGHIWRAEKGKGVVDKIPLTSGQLMVPGRDKGEGRDDSRVSCIIRGVSERDDDGSLSWVQRVRTRRPYYYFLWTQLHTLNVCDTLLLVAEALLLNAVQCASLQDR
jgi:hypothetical protein